MVVVGTLLGLGAAWVGMRMLAGLFSSVASTSASNPTLILGAPLLLGSLALLSCLSCSSPIDPDRAGSCVAPRVTVRQTISHSQRTLMLRSMESVCPE
jgi:hypothetical protein